MASIINALSSGAGGLVSSGDTSGVLQLQNNSSASVTLDASGNVGIGTTSPTTVLHAYANNAGTPTTSGSATTGVTTRFQNSSVNFDIGTYAAGPCFIQSRLINNNATNFDLILNPNGANVGIGTNSPVAQLGILGSGQTTAAMSTSTNLGGTLYLRDSGGSSGNGGALVFGANQGAFTAIKGLITDGANNTLGALAFSTRNSSTDSTLTERMRIDPSGNVLVGATTRTGVSGLFGKLYGETSASDAVQTLYNTGSTPYGLAIGYSTSPNVTGSEFFYCKDSTAQRMAVKSNGGISNYSANNTNLSDQREKTNVELAGSYLDKICAIPVKTFNYIDQNMEEDGGLTLGVIAQDVQAVAPELVTESNWGTEEEPKERLSIYQTDLQYALMKCIQEQQTIINDLKARIETLEAK